MLQNERSRRILKLLSEGEDARVSTLSQRLQVSEATLRRDLDKLEKEGQIQRIHGGAVLVDRRRDIDAPAIIKRAVENQQIKERIGRKAAELIKDGEAVFIGPGTTTMEVARNLCGRKRLTIITNALPVMNLLAQEEGIDIVSTGGLLRSSELSFIGYITEQVMRELRPQKVVMGIRAFSLEKGLTSDYLPEVGTDRVILESGQQIILVADHTKIGRVAAGYVASTSMIDKLVTDDQADPEAVRKLEEMGIEVILC